MKWKTAALLILASVGSIGLFFYTSGKIADMKRVRGELPGARRADAEVVAKSVRDGKHGPMFLVDARGTLDGSPFAVSGRVDEDRWKALSKGDLLRVAARPGGEVEIVGGIGSDDGNLVFDQVLRVVEVLAAILFAAAAAFEIWLLRKHGFGLVELVRAQSRTTST